MANPLESFASGTVTEASAKSSFVADPTVFPCIRCGVCCSIYQVRVSRSEAERIADRMGMNYWDWVGHHCDPRWPDSRSHLIGHTDEACIFLEKADVDVYRCAIYDVRPDSCRNWVAGVFKPACQEGLTRFWNIRVSSRGQLEGDGDSLTRLRRFIGML